MGHIRKLDLSARERQIVQLAAEGHTDASIAHELGISEATVSTYWGRVRIKVGPYSRPELIAKIIRSELDDVVETLQSQNRRLLEQLQKTTGQEWGDPHANYYRKLVEEAADAILVMNERGEIESVNEEFAALFGYQKPEIEGQLLQMLVPERYRRVHIEHREQFLSNPSKRKMAEHSIALGLRKDGTEFPIAASLAPVETSTGTRVICIVREVSRSYM